MKPGRIALSVTELFAHVADTAHEFPTFTASRGLSKPSPLQVPHMQILGWLPPFD